MPVESMLSRICELHRSACEELGIDPTVHIRPQHDGSAHLEVHGEELHLVTTERGSELDRRITTSQEQFLYWLACEKIFRLAQNFERRHRQPGTDSRRLRFATELKYLEAMNQHWSEWRRAEIDQVLLRHPYAS